MCRSMYVCHPVQGTGNVARYLIQKLLEKGVEKVFLHSPLTL